MRPPERAANAEGATAARACFGRGEKKSCGGRRRKRRRRRRNEEKKKEGERKRGGRGFPSIDEISLLLRAPALYTLVVPPFSHQREQDKLTMHITSATHTKRAAKRATLLFIESVALSFFVVVVVVVVVAGPPSPTRNPALPPIAWE